MSLLLEEAVVVVVRRLQLQVESELDRSSCPTQLLLLPLQLRSDDPLKVHCKAKAGLHRSGRTSADHRLPSRRIRWQH